METEDRLSGASALASTSVGDEGAPGSLDPRRPLDADDDEERILGGTTANNLLLMVGEHGTAKWVGYKVTEDEEEGEDSLEADPFLSCGRSGGFGGGVLGFQRHHPTSTSFAALRAQAEALEARHLEAKAAAMRDRLLVSSSGVGSGGHGSGSSAALSSSAESSLLSVRFRPRAFRQLLSEDTLNLKLLQWLQSWSPYVFGRAAARQQQQRTAKKHSGGGEGEEEEAAAAALLRKAAPPAEPPEDRLIILTGPPGSGKTVLVQVLAAHCGYELLEVNASAERTVSKLYTMLNAVVGTGPHTTAAASGNAAGRSAFAARGNEEEDSDEAAAHSLLRPKCLLLDEMDGLTSDVIEKILQQNFTRPVFCVCNDILSPSLRRLRQQYSHCIHYAQPIRTQRLSQRLEDLVHTVYPQQQGIVTSSVLSELVLESNGDIRSCLNTLQFLCLQPPAAPSQSSTTILQQMEKDRSLNYFTACSSYLRRLTRHEAIQALKQHYQVDYELLLTMGMTAAAAARDGRCDWEADTEVAPGFRVDPGYLLLQMRATSPAAPLAAVGPLLLDGLFEHYPVQDHCLEMDYTMAATARVAAEAFSFQDVLTTRGFGVGGSSIGFAEQYSSEVCPLILYAAEVQCGSRPSNQSSSSASPRHSLPRDSFQLQQRVSLSHLVRLSLREASKLLPGYVVPGKLGVDAYPTDWAPYLCWCLYDMTIRGASVHQQRRWARGGAGTSIDASVVKSLQSAVARHVAYGLSYRPPAKRLMLRDDDEGGQKALPTTDGSSGPPAAEGAGSSSSFRADRITWELNPAVDDLGFLLRPFSKENSRHNSSGNRPSHQGQQHASIAGVKRTFSAMQQPPGTGTAASSGGHSESRTGKPSPLLSIRDDLRQYMVGEVQRHIILQQHNRSAATSTKSTRTTTTTTTTAAPPVAPSEVKVAAPRITSSSSLSAAGGGSGGGSGSAAPPQKPRIVKRDFFGRPIVSSPVASPTQGGGNNSSSGGGFPAAGGGAAAAQTQRVAEEEEKPIVKYVYVEGSTNAVKVPATFDDF